MMAGEKRMIVMWYDVDDDVLKDIIDYTQS